MNYRIEFVNELMTVADGHGYGHEAYEVDRERPWDAVAVLAEWGRKYSLDACRAMKKLRSYLRDCE